MSLTKTNPGCSARKERVRQSLTMQAKVQIINEYDSGQKVCNISKEYLLPESTVRTILKNKKRILHAVKNEGLLNAKSLSSKRHGVAQMESILLKWCEDQTKDNVTLTPQDVCSQALQIFETLKRMNKTGKKEKFLASKGWYTRFKIRCDFTRNSDEPETIVSGPILDGDEIEVVEKISDSSAENYQYNLRQIIEEGCYTPQTVFNVNETGLFWKRMPEGCYLEQLDKSSPGLKVSKDRLTVMIGGNAAGDFKLKPLLVYRNENPRALQGKSKGGLPVIWKSNSEGCITASIFEDWFGYHFIPEVGRYCSSIDIPFKVLLIISSAPGHPLGTLIDFDHRVKVVFIPPEETYSIQPMTQQVVTTFRAQYTRRLFVHLNDFLKQHTMLSIEEAWEKYNILDAIRIIVDSWADISEDDCTKAWENLFPSSANNENYLIDNSTSEENRDTQIIEEIVNLAAELDMKINVNDVYRLLDSHNDEPTVTDFVEMRKQNATDELDNSDPLINKETMTVNKLSEALGHIKMGLQILQDIDPNEQRARNTILEFSNILRPYEEILCTKIQIIAPKIKSEENEQLSFHE